MKAMDILQGPRERLTSQVQKGATVPLFILSSKAHFGSQVHSSFAGTRLLLVFFINESK
jgi:ABC-type molybdate transport system substrate-binding protein